MGHNKQKIIELKAVSKFYGHDNVDFLALKDVTFEVYEGEFLCIVGPSGCGKSTLLKLISGLLTVTSGSLLFRGTPVSGVQDNMAMVFQNPVLLEWRSVFDNVMLPIEILKLDEKTHRKNGSDLLKLAGLEDFEKKYPRQLSGGMKQRVSLVRALISNPSVLLMDEPFGALDAITRENLSYELLHIWEKTRKTIIFVTHDISEAVFLGDRIIILTSRPGTVAEAIEVDLERPRTPETRIDPRHIELAHKIYKIISVN
jgi:NitT/TauT family transport system ATP-binding protein